MRMLLRVLVISTKQTFMQIILRARGGDGMREMVKKYGRKKKTLEARISLLCLF